MMPRPHPEAMKKEAHELHELTRILLIFFSCFSWIIFIVVKFILSLQGNN